MGLFDVTDLRHFSDSGIFDSKLGEQMDNKEAASRLKQWMQGEEETKERSKLITKVGAR